MEIKAKLNKPYTNKQRANFIVENNHIKGYEIKETETDLEAWGLTAEEQAEKDLENKKAFVRAIRNFYLEETDKYMIVDFPVSDEERGTYKDYRQYLRDYTKEENWWDSEPFKFAEWQTAEEKDNDK